MTDAPPLGTMGRVARALACVGLGYWGIYALVAPVTTIDSHMYNLARVELAERGGLFDNVYFTSVFHVIFPWGFDAVHLPFLHLGWGCVLPSYACLVGVCFVVFTLVRARLGGEAAWVAVLGLLALPCFVYQGASTKNDMAVVFGLAAWTYARWRWRSTGGGWHQFWMVLAIGFTVGAKTSGVFYGFVLAAWTLWELRSQARLIGRVVGGLAVAVLLFGSVETYVETARIYGHPLGPPPLVRRLGNRDGLRGGAANFIRHVGAGVYVGPTRPGEADGPVAAISSATADLIARLGLADAGNAPLFRDRNLSFAQTGLEELSGFGPVGTLAVAMLLLAGVWWRPRESWWPPALAGLGMLALVSQTVAYTQWTNRYLIGAYALGAVAFVCVLWERDSRWRRAARPIFLGIAAFGVVAAPLLSFNRRPQDLVAAVRDRERFETATTPVTGRMRERLRALRAATPDCRVYVVVFDESVMLPYLEDEKLDALLVTQARLDELALAGRLADGDLVAAAEVHREPYLHEVERVTAPNVFSKDGTVTEWIYRVQKTKRVAAESADG